jgi:succinyl-CoA synthetase beta subunit
MVNGAGLAMATMDIIKFRVANRPTSRRRWGQRPDGRRRVSIILKDPKREGHPHQHLCGIVRHDCGHRVVEAYKNIGDINASSCACKGLTLKKVPIIDEKAA